MPLCCLAMFWLHLGMFKVALVLWALLQIPLILVILHLFIVLYRCIPTLATDLLANSSFITNLAGNNITKSVIEAGLQWVHSLYQWLFPFWYWQHFLNSLFKVICFHKYHLSRLHFLCTRKYRSKMIPQYCTIHLALHILAITNSYKKSVYTRLESNNFISKSVLSLSDCSFVTCP